MEHISEILKNQTRTNISKASMDTSSSAKSDEAVSKAECPICHGAGYVHLKLPSGKVDYSRVVPCRCVRNEVDKGKEERLLKFSNLGVLSRFTFENFNPQGRSGNPRNQEQYYRAFQIAKVYAAKPEGWLVLMGTSACGKTHLAAAIANDCMKQGKAVYFLTVPELLDHLRSAFNPDSEVPYDELFERVKNVPILILDDLGVQTTTPWAREKLDQLLNYRFNARLATVIVPIVPLEELDERLRTRLTDPGLSHIAILEERPPITLDYSWPPGFELQKTMTFSKFERRVNLPAEVQDNLEMAQRLAMDFAKQPEGWLVFMGVTGCGKTHLAAAIVNYRYQAGQPALFIIVPEFLDHLRSTFSPESKVSYDRLFESVKTAPLLVLDDFGEQSTTPWAREKLYQVINYRYNARLATVITTRYSLEEIINKVDESVSSRLVDKQISTPFNITAPDYRGDLHATKRQTYRRPNRGRAS